MTRPLNAVQGLGLIVTVAAALHLQADQSQKARPVRRSAAGAAASSAAKPASAAPLAREVIQKYCVTCHNQKLRTAGLLLDTPDAARTGDHSDVWEKVVRKLRTGEMPPPGLPRPDRATYATTTTELERALEATAAARPNPGRVAVHRLNRSEYSAAIRDLLG